MRANSRWFCWEIYSSSWTRIDTHSNKKHSYLHKQSRAHTYLQVNSWRVKPEENRGWIDGGERRGEVRGRAGALTEQWRGLITGQLGTLKAISKNYCQMNRLKHLTAVSQTACSWFWLQIKSSGRWHKRLGRGEGGREEEKGKDTAWEGAWHWRKMEKLQKKSCLSADTSS